jgi:hypothetical protein
VSITGTSMSLTSTTTSFTVSAGTSITIGTVGSGSSVGITAPSSGSLGLTAGQVSLTGTSSSLPYFLMSTANSPHAIRVYIQSATPSATGVPEGSIYIDTFSSLGAIWVLRAGAWNKLAWATNYAVPVPHDHP